MVLPLTPPLFHAAGCCFTMLLLYAAVASLRRCTTPPLHYDTDVSHGFFSLMLLSRRRYITTPMLHDAA